MRQIEVRSQKSEVRIVARALLPAESTLVSTLVPLLALTASLFPSCTTETSIELSGELRTWHPVTLTFTGPDTSEADETNPFTDYRLNVTFSGPSGQFVAPGYYAADGNSAESGSESGSKWRVHFVPDSVGSWQYEASFRKGEAVAIDPSPEAGSPAEFDGAAGSFQVTASNGNGILQYVGERYLKYAGTGEYFLKGGADSPENFLAYEDFDGTWDRSAHNSQRSTFLHRYEPHIQDWTEGDPTWRGGKGKGIIGGLNYLASKGVNSVYFLTQNIDGDGDDVWPWRDPEDYSRFDCSKLDQWEIVFQHMDRLGIMLHVVTAETENDDLLDGGELGPDRKLYYRELIARFSHHRALVWNLGEENTNTPEQVKAFSRYIHETDPYDHPVVMHTHATPEHHEKRYGPLLGYEHFDGASMQIREDELVNPVVANWIKRSGEAGRQWVVTFDEQRTGATGVEPDAVDEWHDGARYRHLWSTLLAGGAGIEWYFGYNYQHDDLTCEDWRTRENLWEITRIALDFMREHVPFTEMMAANELTRLKDDYVFAKPGEVYLVYVPAEERRRLRLYLNLEKLRDRFTVQWFNPRTGGALKSGSVKQVRGPGWKPLGQPPADPAEDWVVLVKKVTE